MLTSKLRRFSLVPITTDKNVIERFSLFLSIVLTLSIWFQVVPAQAADSDGTGITIAVMDYTGTDSSSPELNGVITHEVCLDSYAKYDASNSRLNHCPGFRSLEEGVGVAAPNFKTNGELLWSTSGHGTSVASVVAGKTVGVAKGVRIIAIRHIAQATPAYQWVLDNAIKYNISALVQSEGSVPGPDSRAWKPCEQARETTPVLVDIPLAPYVRKLHDAGIAFFVSSGNESNTTNIAEPSCLSGAISVGATGVSNYLEPKNDQGIALYSNISTKLSILAPGTNKASVSQGKNLFTISDVNGTSFAAPYAAAVYGKVKALYPTLSIDQILAIMRTTGDLKDDIKVKKIPAINQAALCNFISSGKSIPSLESTFIDQESSFTTVSSQKDTVLINSLTDRLTKLEEQNNALIASMKAEAKTLEEQNSALIASLRVQVKSLDEQIGLLKIQIAASTVSKESTINCVKGSISKKVTGKTPICPIGWKKK